MLSLTDVVLQLPEIVPTISSSLIFMFLLTSKLESVDELPGDGGCADSGGGGALFAIIFLNTKILLYYEY